MLYLYDSPYLRCTHITLLFFRFPCTHATIDTGCHNTRAGDKHATASCESEQHIFRTCRPIQRLGLVPLYHLPLSPSSSCFETGSQIAPVLLFTCKSAMFSFHPYLLRRSASKDLSKTDLPRSYEHDLPTHKHPRPRTISVTRSRKASPTVVLTNANANANCINASIFSSPTSIDLQEQNCIPFPSSTSPILPFSDAPVSQPDCRALLRVRSPGVDREKRDAGNRWVFTRSARVVHSTPRRRKLITVDILADKRYFDPSSTSAPDKALQPARRTKRGGSRDLMLLATLHRSIIWMMTLDDSMDVDSEDWEGNLKTQDRILVGRLTHYLSQQGWCQPLPSIEMTFPSPAFPEYNISNQDSPQLTAMPITNSLTSLASKSPMLAPVLTMPQLVASLIIRHQERSRAVPRPINTRRDRALSSASSRPRSPLSSEL